MGQPNQRTTLSGPKVNIASYLTPCLVSDVSKAILGPTIFAGRDRDHYRPLVVGWVGSVT